MRRGEMYVTVCKLSLKNTFFQAVNKQVKLHRNNGSRGRLLSVGSEQRQHSLSKEVVGKHGRGRGHHRQWWPFRDELCMPTVSEFLRSQNSVQTVHPTKVLRMKP